MPRILILNGPNLDLLGVREPEIYGATTLAAIGASCRDLAGVLGVEVDLRQSNHEGVLIDWIHAARETCDALIINPAGLSFRSIALLDALRTFEGPVIELHISNIHARDEAHRNSLISQVATSVICGLGPYGYIVALLAAARRVGNLPETLPEPLRVGPV